MSLSRLLPPFVVLLLVFSLGGVAGAGEDGTQPETLPADAVARVDDRIIKHSLYRHWKQLARKSSVGRPREAELRRDVMSFLLSGTWVELEAKRRGLRVSSRQVRRNFERQRRHAFKNRREYRRYLRESGQTEEDILFRVRLELLSSRVRKDVIGDVKGTRRQMRRLERFVAKFEARWRKRTVCARGYRVAECGSVVAPAKPEAGETPAP